MRKMFDEILTSLCSQEEEYLALKKEVAGTPLESSIDSILNKIFDDFKKIIELKGEI